MSVWLKKEALVVEDTIDIFIMTGSNDLLLFIFFTVLFDLK